MFRSRDIALYDVFFPKDYAWEIMNQLGDLDILCFDNLNKELISSELPYDNEIKEIGTYIEKIQQIEGVMKEHGLFATRTDLNKETISDIVLYIQNTLKNTLQTDYYNDLKREITKSHELALELKTEYQEIQNKISQSDDYIIALQKFADKVPFNFKNKRTASSSLRNEVQLTYMLGCLSNESVANFQRSLFRISRGNVFASYSSTENDPKNNRTKGDNKTILFLAFQASTDYVLGDKIRKLAEAFSVQLFEVPEDFLELKNNLANAYLDNSEAHKISHATLERIHENLHFYTMNVKGINVPYINVVKAALYKQITIYENLNKFVINGRFLTGSFWIANIDEDNYHSAIIAKKNNPEFKAFKHFRIDHRHTKKEPPTLFLSNEFIYPFQEIIDTYGVPNYKEINPTLFTLVSFPFMFGVMFGDFGHGLMLTLFALSLYLFDSKALLAAKPYRSLLLIMGIFSCYCGLVYNEFLSVPIPIFNSCYQKTETSFIRITENCVYPFGFDFTWDMSKESISFVNSFKMKLSIVVGVIHMSLGIVLKGLNKLKFRDYLSFFFEFFPQIIFFLSTFGYMCVCIIVKWLTQFPNPSNAPSIINLFINLVTGIDTPLIVSADFQLNLQRVLAILALICVPTMFFVKPIIIALKSKKGSHKKYSLAPQPENFVINNPDLDESESQAFISRKNSSFIDAEDHNNEEHDITEVFVHQGIETIEFILGSISNTASYLRLWALSLAHSQLAKVFLEMLIKPYFNGSFRNEINFIFLPIMFILFFFVTVGVLMIMDLMECFLHALRLHWVEFQNKFYSGEGKRFISYSFTGLVRDHFELNGEL